MPDALEDVRLQSQILQVEARAETERLLIDLAFGGPAVGAQDTSLHFYQLLNRFLAVSGDDRTRAAAASFDAARANSLALQDDHALLMTVATGWLADKGSLAAKLLSGQRESRSNVPPAIGWDKVVRRRVLDVWLGLFSIRSIDDRAAILDIVSRTQQEQAAAEPEFLTSHSNPVAAAWSLVAEYHLLKASTIVAAYLWDGESDGTFDIREQLELHFDNAVSASERAGDAALRELSQTLALAAGQMIDNSLWSTARSAGPQVRAFVQQLTSRQRPILELLPPQRVALSDEGLARAAQRAVVVSLPTSAGKTLIAEYRIIQSLSVFRSSRGWVAYVAPTRALVNQITTRLRRDLGALGIQVEKVSPALEIDGVEAELLTSDSEPFDVLVATPEKLDLMLRGGWVEQIGRPLALVVVDEAHNLAEGRRGLSLELLLTTINREARDSQFLLLTPFIPNGAEVASWLDQQSNQSVSVSLDWQPNDRVIVLATPAPGPRRGDFHVQLKPIAASKPTLVSQISYSAPTNRPLGLTLSQASSPNRLAAAAAHALSFRGSTILLVGQPDYAWTAARTLADALPDKDLPSQLVTDTIKVLQHDLGADFPLIAMLRKGIGVHHAGLPDDVKALMEQLLEREEIDFLVATTTIAQGLNFPVANVVFATHQYPYGEKMPSADFWNIAGRAGRVDQSQPGIVAMAAHDNDRETALEQYVQTAESDLGSALINLVVTTLREFGQLDLRSLAYREEWSTFLQFIAHSFRMRADPAAFAVEVEQILRGTFGYRLLRRDIPEAAQKLIDAVREYARGLAGRPLSLVDSTGFSWESVAGALGEISERSLGPATWDTPLFGTNREALTDLIGVMLRVPELRTKLLEAAPAEGPGNFLANVTHDWVNGVSIPDLASTYFPDQGGDLAKSITRCCKRIFGDIAPTVAWGLGAIQSLTLAGSDSAEDPATRERLRNIPSFALYGVSSERAVALRLMGVPRSATDPLMRLYGASSPADFGSLRTWLRSTRESDWTAAIGQAGASYFRAWRASEGTDTAPPTANERLP
ncbi:DEAD/DEAH box helicase [Pseudolysinimonas sp.]|jgi:hypothetical protein|uniref:DEAD/DEAH box helicase n=1 Tax=Pseudolysinimonas sp. TaxID=2680009 RepID=UPI0037830E43